jgi:hypothetical protein
MAAFTDILEQVYSITRRSDLAAQSIDAVKAATLKLHTVNPLTQGAEYYPQDYFEQGVQFSTSDYLQSFEYAGVISRFRTLDYIRKMDYDTSGSVLPGKFLTPITPKEALDRYNVQKEDVCYLAGKAIQIKSSTLLQYVIVGCYIYPDTAQGTYTSWIADEFPYLVALEAAKIVQGASGNDQITRFIAAELATQYPSLLGKIVAMPFI